MKQKYTLLLGLLVAANSYFAQTFTDNFDAYTAGNKLASQSSGAWTTWSNAPGGTEDVDVINTDSHSSPNSIYLSSSTTTGGPTDLVRKFGGTYTSGQFSVEMWMKVQAGKGAYFNIQGASPIGSMYSVECFFKADQSIVMSNTTDGTVLTGSYTQGVWFKYNLNIDMNTNTWEVLVDGVSQGTFSNANNQVWAIDIFPVNSDAPNLSGYFIDDFTTTYTPYVAVGLDLATTGMSMTGNIAGVNQNPSMTVKNLGTTAITSFDMMVDYNGIQQTDNITGVNIASLSSYTFTFSHPINLAAGSNPLVATVSNVNGTTDDVASNDSKTWTINPIVPALGKVVVAEEGTGTWCQWCPRGAVFMDKFTTQYAGVFAGIAVHNGDVMTVTDYDAGMALSSFPGAKVDRGTVKDPSAIEPDILSRLMIAPTAFITNGATWDAGTRELKVSVSCDFKASATSAYKVACVLTEDDVTGTASGYKQSNAYAGGGNGVMGGFESLPNPVPAAQMVYNHVARIISPSFTGATNSFPATVAVGEVHVVNFTFTLPASWDENNIHIIGLLRAPNGTIDNAGTATIPEAVANGYVDGVSTASVTELSQVDTQIQMYPNPAETYTNVVLNLKEQQNVQLNLVDITGKVLRSKNYGILSGGQQLQIPTASLESGIYFVQITLGTTTSSLRLIVK